MISYKLLGNLSVLRDGRELVPSSPRVLSTLALLLVRANGLVSADTLVQELWGPEPPRSAGTTAQTYIYLLRKWLDAEQISVDGAALITRAPGYVLELEPESIDVTIFESRVDEGRALLARNDPGAAGVKLRAALDMWAGPAMSNVRAGDIVSRYAVALDETGKRALDLRIHADMLMGRHRDIIGELRSLAAGSPYNEWYQSVLISALASAGRRHEALAVYAEAQRVLSEDLGLSPSAQLRAVFQAVLDGEMPDLTDCGMNITTAS